MEGLSSQPTLGGVWAGAGGGLAQGTLVGRVRAYVLYRMCSAPD